MLGSVETLDWSFLKHIQDHIPVCKCLLCGSALGHQDEECGLQIESFDHFCSIVRVHVGDELCVQCPYSGACGPALQGKVEGSGAKVGSADSNLAHCLELLSCGTFDLALPDFV